MARIRRMRPVSGGDGRADRRIREGRRRIIAHVGSAHTDAEIGLLLQLARELLADAGQVSSTSASSRRRCRRVARPGRRAVLFGQEALPVLPARERRVVAAPRVVARGPRLLYDVLAGVLTGLGFDPLGDELLRAR